MKPKNTLCIAEWQSFGFNEVKQALEANHKINATLNNSNAEWSETKATITSEAKAIESKAQSIFNELVDFTLQSKDYPTFNFLQWYVSEQHEEEALFRGIVDKIKLIGSNGDGPYLADRFIKELASK